MCNFIMAIILDFFIQFNTNKYTFSILLYKMSRENNLKNNNFSAQEWFVIQSKWKFPQKKKKKKKTIEKI